MKIRWDQIQVGDRIGDVHVTEVYRDPDGLWVRTSDDDCGYIINEQAAVTIERE